MALAMFTLALNARATTIEWLYTGNFVSINLGDYGGPQKNITDPDIVIVQITAYIIWDYDKAPLGNKEIIINLLKDGEFKIDGTADEIAGVEEAITLANLGSKHTTTLANLEYDTDYILDVVFLIQLKHDVLEEGEYLWYDPMHTVFFHEDYEPQNLIFYAGDFYGTGLFKPIPEPATGLLAALGGFVLLLRRKRG